MYHADTLEQGDPFKSTLAFVNVSDIPMDSLLIRFRIENEIGEDKTLLRRVKNLPVGDSIQFSFTEETRTRKGRHRWVVEVNPDQDQPEQYQFNNVMYQDFYVRGDKRNPQLDITFDGLHIFDGDLISPQPLIVLTLKDENRFLAMTDTATMALQLYAPDQVRKIYLSDPDVQFLPADGAQLPKKNLARLEWRPLFTADGVYRLLVNGRDAAGNPAGALDAAISFKVLTKSSISNLLNYPNPFSSSTCFVYTMSGAETPTDFRLQIMTVSGRVVREVTASEFGPLRAGTHQSDFCWDGKDMYGDQLANGVYLYRITARKADGSVFDLYENDQVDGYFKHGFGKMVLMR
jgi:hypothetical protein